MAKYISKDGDMLDQICHDFYGESKKFTELVLEKNSRLANYDTVLPAGVEINLPDAIEVEQESTLIRLWD